MESLITVTVACGTRTRQTVLTVRVPATATLREAIERSGMLREWPQLDLAGASIGVHGRLCAADEAAREGDRIEIYRPLEVDPKAARRARAAS